MIVPLVVLDDLHWADEATLHLLRHLARAVTDERLLVVANARPTDERGGRLLRLLEGEPTVSSIDLGGLPPAAVQRQLRT